MIRRRLLFGEKPQTGVWHHTMRWNQSVRHVMVVTVVGKSQLVSTLYRDQRRDGAPSPTTKPVLHQALVKFLRETRLQYVIKMHGPSDRDIVDTRLDTVPLILDVTT